MNIYFVSWTSLYGFGLDAAVVAESDARAIEMLDLSDASEVAAVVIGVALEGIEPHIISQASL